MARCWSEDEARRVRIDDDLRALDHLRRLRAAADRPPGGIAATGDLGRVARRAPRARRRRAARARRRCSPPLAELEPMGPVGPVELDEVQLVLAPRLRDAHRCRRRARRYGAVFVGTRRAARGLAFDVVFVPGLAEKIFPRKIVEDPLLLDGERRGLGSGVLETETERAPPSGWRCGSAVGAREPARLPLLSAGRRRAGAPAGPVVLRARGAARRRRATAGLRRASRAAPSDGGRPPRLAGAWPAAHGHRRGRVRPRRCWRRCSTRDPKTTHRDGAVSARRQRRIWRVRCARARRRWCEALDAGRRARRSRRARRARRSRAHQLGRALVLADGAAALRRLPVPVLPAGRASAEAARGADRDRDDRPADARLRCSTRCSSACFDELRDAACCRSAGRNSSGALDVDGSRCSTRRGGACREKLAPAIPRVWDDGIDGMRADLREWLRRACGRRTGWVPDRFELSFGLAVRERGSATGERARPGRGARRPARCAGRSTWSSARARRAPRHRPQDRQGARERRAS